jgi:hypothetical protein
LSFDACLALSVSFLALGAFWVFGALLGFNCIPTLAVDSNLVTIPAYLTFLALIIFFFFLLAIATFSQGLLFS